MSLYRLNGSVALVTLDHPSVNSLGHALRCHIVNALEAAVADPAVAAIVLAGEGRAFSAGADVMELGTLRQRAEPVLPQVLAAIEDCRKPVVAAVTGTALGGGFELAMACHARVAAADALVGLPEISLGVIPGAGGTQRLPRLAGPAVALDMILSAQARRADGLAGTRLFDEIVNEAPLEAAFARARQIAQAVPQFQLTRELAVDARELDDAVAAARRKLNARQRLQPAYTAAIDAVAAVSRPFEEGLARERALFLELVTSPDALALRYQFKAERATKRLPESLQASPRPWASIAVVGAGTMGSGIAIAALEAGLPVTLMDQDADALRRGAGHVADYYRERVASGRLDQAQADARLGRLHGTTEWSALAEVDVVIEAVFEDLAVKHEVFKRLDAVARPGAVLATNTSCLDVDSIAAVTTRPGDVLGLHFFSPANVMKLVEVVRGARTSPDVLATGVELALRLRNIPVVCGNGFGFIGNRIYNAYRRECEFMLEDGAWPEEVDSALLAFGFAMGPSRWRTCRAWTSPGACARPRRPAATRARYIDILDRLCEAGRLGRKAGAGYYRYQDGKQAPESDEVVRRLITEASARRGIERRHLAPKEIERRALVAMVNEAALLLSQEIAMRPSDVDVVLVNGYGLPKWKGGPMYWAGRQDRAALEADVEAMVWSAGPGATAADLGPLFGPA